MPVIRIDKNKDFTTIANYVFKDNRLSLKAKGLLTQMLSLPDDWEYTLKGLTSLFSDGQDSIRAAIHELERYGYIVRKRVRDEKGRLGGTEYIIYEKPQDIPEDETAETEPDSASPEPTEDEPMETMPVQDEATTYKELTKSNKKELNTDSINPSLPFLQVSREEADEGEAKRKEMSAEEIENYREVIRYNIDYDVLVDDHPEDKNRLDEVVELLTETVCSTKKYIRIGGNDYPTEAVKARLLQLDMYHIKFVFDCMSKNKTKIRNIRQYLLTALYNAPSTIENYYSAKVNHDLYGED